MFYPPLSHPPEPPPLVCEYGPVSLVYVLREVQQMIKALLPDGRLQIVSQQPGSLETIPAWCQATGHTVVWQSTRRSWLMLESPGGVDEDVFDVERGER